MQKYVSLAQLVEQLTLNQWVESSSLSGDTKKGHPFGCPFFVPPERLEEPRGMRCPPVGETPAGRGDIRLGVLFLCLRETRRASRDAVSPSGGNPSGKG